MLRGRKFAKGGGSMSFFDAMLTLGPTGRMRSVTWGNETARQLYHLLFESWIARQQKVGTVFPLPEGKESGSFTWDEDTFFFQLLPAPDQNSYLLLAREDHREELYTQTLNFLSEGVQIYDKNAQAVYFNRASRGISHIPDEIQVEGSHLLDLYNLDEEISTTMTALRTQSPVINRVDHFKVSNDTSLTTANTSYPIVKDGKLLGAVVFEETEAILTKMIQTMETSRRALNSFASRAKEISFSGYTFGNVIGQGEKLQNAVALAQKVASQSSSVLLVGETGTGKEIFAQSIHRASPRSSKKFLAINCAAIPDTLIESLLFGTQKGSFTGSEDKAGYLEEANGGTLFLDELNSMSLSMQSKLLRVIQENTFRRVGGHKDLPLDVRIISSCNEDPTRAIAENKFRRDLFYRLSTVMIELPPLREHLEDLEELIRYHLGSTSFQYVNAITEVDPRVYQILRRHNWPGNVRELFHVLDYAQNVANSSVMLPEHLPSYLLKGEAARPARTGGDEPVDFSAETLQSLLDDYEHKILLQALDYCGYNISRTAQTLGILRQSLQYRIRKYGIVI